MWRPAYLPRLMCFCLVVFILFLATALTFPYTERVSVAGVVRPHKEPVRLVATHSGRIAALLTDEGVQVARGQPLARLDHRVFGTSGFALSELEIKRLGLRERYLRRQLAQGHHIHLQRLELQRIRLENLDQEAVFLAEQVAQQNIDLQLAREAHERVASLADRQMVSEHELGQAISTLLSRQQAHARQRHERERIRAEQLQVTQSRAVLEAEWLMQKRDLEHELEDLSVELKRAAETDEVTLVAGIDGVVSDVRFQAGAWVERGAAVLSILDSQGRARVELHVPDELMGRVAEGAEVFLSFSGYPVADYGVAKGRLKKPASVARRLRDRAYYKTMVVIEQLPEDLGHLPAGMIVTANIALAADPVWRWMIKPLITLWRSI